MTTIGCRSAARGWLGCELRAGGAHLAPPGCESASEATEVGEARA